MLVQEGDLSHYFYAFNADFSLEKFQQEHDARAHDDDCPEIEDVALAYLNCDGSRPSIYTALEAIDCDRGTRGSGDIKTYSAQQIRIAIRRVLHPWERKFLADVLRHVETSKSVKIWFT